MAAGLPPVAVAAGGVALERDVGLRARRLLVPLPDGVDPVAAASVADNVVDGFRHVGPHLPALLAEDADAPRALTAHVRSAATKTVLS